LYAAAVAELEQHLLAQVLRHTRGSQLQAARLLGISRNSLRGKLRALGLTIERSVRSPRWSS
jgi:two-component system nitrogen regulation response regulator GlnG